MEKKIVPLSYERLPQFLIKQIGEELELDDRLNFMVGFLLLRNIYIEISGKFSACS